jgi:serine protease Do
MTRFRQMAIAFVAMTLAGTAYGDTNGAKALSLSFRDAVKKAKPAVVYIESTVPVDNGFYRWTSVASGSGVIIDAKKGYVLTAAHLIDEARKVTVRLEDGRKFTAKEKWADAQSDVGLLQIEADKLPEAKLGDSDQLEIGDWVLAIGSPFGRALENSVSAGIVSAKGRKTNVLGDMGIEDFIQTDAAINRGNSGGPLVNLDGEVVGINSNIISSTGMNAGLGFAVPSKLARTAVEQLIKGGRVARGYMGVGLKSLKELQESEPALAKKIDKTTRDAGGIYVQDVVPGEPAAEAGMKPGDVILSLDGKRITEASELVDYISMKAPGDVVKCDIWRDGKTLSISATLAERPTNEELAAAAQAGTGAGGRASYSYRTIGLLVSDYAGLAADQRGHRTRIRAIVVEHVRANSPADKAGIEVGDVIESVGGDAVPDGRTFENLLKNADLKKGVSMSIINGQGERDVVIKK